MRVHRHLAALIVVCLAGAGPAVAQIGSAEPPMTPPIGPDALRPGAKLQLTETQKKAIFEAVNHDKKTIRPPADVQLSVGAPVPPDSDLHMLPDAAVAPNPQLNIYRYTIVQEQVLLVDPTNMRIVAVIDR